MKLSITDQFLWAVYNFLEKTDEILYVAGISKVRSLRETLHPDLTKFWQAIEQKKRKKQFAQFIDYLKRKGYIKIADLQGKKGILITPEGKKKALRTKFILERKNLKRRKDGKWVMVIFDIPERKRGYRDMLRGVLGSLGFRMLQKSIWVSPYDVLDKMEDFARTYSLYSYIKIFIIEEP